MSNWLKYLLPAIVVCVVVSCNTDSSVSEVSDGDIREFAVDVLSCQTSVSETESELCLPRQISVTNTVRVQNAARRTNFLQRNNIEFARSGKVMNAGLTYIIQRKSIIIGSSRIEPTFRLLSLGKLII